MTIRRTRPALALALAVLFAPSVALAAEGFARSSASLRAGPGNDYPRVARVSAGESLEIYGCLRRASWCDVAADGDRGWFPGNRIDFLRSGRRARLSSDAGMFGLSVLTFGIGDYWGAHYGGRSWIDDRRWRSGPRDPGFGRETRPPPPSNLDRPGDGRPPIRSGPVVRPDAPKPPMIGRPAPVDHPTPVPTEARPPRLEPSPRGDVAPDRVRRPDQAGRPERQEQAPQQNRREQPTRPDRRERPPQPNRQEAPSGGPIEPLRRPD